MTTNEQDTRTYSITIREFVRPDGRVREVTFDTIDRELYEKANAILTHGWLFEAELLPATNQVYLSVSNFNRDIANEITTNTELAVETAMQKLIEHAYKEIVSDE